MFQTKQSMKDFYIVILSQTNSGDSYIIVRPPVKDYSEYGMSGIICNETKIKIRPDVIVIVIAFKRAARSLLKFTSSW